MIGSRDVRALTPWKEGWVGPVLDSSPAPCGFIHAHRASSSSLGRKGSSDCKAPDLRENIRSTNCPELDVEIQS